MKWFIVILILTLVGIAGCTQPTTPEIDFYSCTQDSDCIKVDGGCCNCNHDGTATAINKNFEKEWQDKLSDECQGTACLTVLSGHPSCFKNPKCLDNKCVLIDPRCDWWAGNCLMVVGPGYFYDSQTNECHYYEGSGCSSPPFSTMEECEKACK